MKHLFSLIILLAVGFLQNAAAQYLQFVENKGQWDSSVKFNAALNAGQLNLKPSGYRVVLHNKEQLKELSEFYGKKAGKPASGKQELKKAATRLLKLHSHAYEVAFLNADDNALAIPEKPEAIVNNYFIGTDSSKWRSGCRVFNALTYKNVYKNIDIRYYTDNGNLKYDIIVNPGADISKLAMKFKGLDGLAINKYGNLAMKTSLGEMYQSIPLSYQVLKNLRSKVKVKFKIEGDIVRFDIDKYDKTATLVIDPTVIFSSFTGSAADNWGYTATYDNAGNLYAGGIAFNSGYNPRGLGGYDQSFNGGDNIEGVGPFDVAFMKFNPIGTLGLYATYFGGDGDEQPHSMVTDAQGNLIISGRTSSGNLPTTIGTFGPGGSFDIFLAKFSPDGLRLLASRKFGGTKADGVNIRPKYIDPDGIDETRRNYGDDARSEVLVDGLNNIYLASCTQSSDFLTTTNAFRKTLGGRQDGVFIKASPDLSNLFMCSFLGGNGSDAAFVLTFNEVNGNIYVAGGTTSTDLALNATNAPQGIVRNSYQGGEVDGFITMLNPTGESILKTCYIGTAGNDMVYGVQCDKFGFPYIMGTTTTSFPVFNSPFNANNNQVNGKQFITKLSADLTSVQYSANFGRGAGIPDISPTAFLVDVCSNVYVSGWGGLQNGTYYENQSVAGMSVTSNALSNQSDGSDFYFFVLEKNALSQLFGSFYGSLGSSTAADHVDGGTSRFDRRGVIYQAVCANCRKNGTFPTTTGSWSPGNGAQAGAGSECNEAAMKIAFELSGIFSGVRPSIKGVLRDSVGCIPLTVDFADTVAMGKSYRWDFGDGSPQVTTPTPNASHTYTNTGNYRVMLISIDSASCNISDTSYVLVRAKDNPASVGLTVAKLLPCESLNYQFNNTSVPPAGFSFKPGTFTWNFGDGTIIQSDAPTITHQYAVPGPYIVKLSLNDTTFCNSPDSVVLDLRVAAALIAEFTAPSTGCVLDDILFDNISIGGQSFVWNFGDGNTSTDISPVHQYAFPGTYTVTLTANDALTCNPTDDTSMVITIVDGPTASFTYTPTTPIENTPYVFTNTSVNATNYKWFFGDGDSLLTSSTLPVTHIYNKSGDFIVQLIAYNASGCTDTAFSTITTIVTPVVDVPNAFSPNGDGTNDIIYVQGYAIGKLTWRIYNRWGQLMFTSTSVNAGWNGRFKGALQAQDVYGYTLSIEFTDGTRVNKKGDITLLR